MQSELLMGYIVYVDGDATKVGRSLEEAKRLAEEHMVNKQPLRIESAVAPAPSQIWNYDYEIRAWVERK
jgi:hypothetical protein